MQTATQQRVERTGTVLVDNLVRLERLVSKLNTKVRSLNAHHNLRLPLITLATGEEFWQPTSTLADDIALARFVHVTVSGDLPDLASEWEFCGTLTNALSGSANVVREVPGRSIPPEFWNRSVCDACGTARDRKATFVVRHRTTGEFKQVGRNCLADFFASPAVEQLLDFYATLLKALREDFDGAEGEDEPSYSGGRCTNRAVGLQAYLSHVCAMAEHSGFVSKKDADADWGKVPTAWTAWGNVFPNPYDKVKPLPVTDQHRAEAERILAWAATEFDLTRQALNDSYRHNIATYLHGGVVDYAGVGLVASLYAGWQRYLGEQQPGDADEWLGEPKQRAEFALQFVGSRTIDGGLYGVSYLCRFRGPAGEQVVWFASNPPELELKKSYRIKGTVKEHGTFKNRKQTVLTRCKVAGQVAAEAAS